MVRDDRRQGALGEQPVADLPPARPAHEAGLADAERREVVVDHEGLLVVGVLDPLLPLAVDLGAERGRHEGLRLAAREHGRAVGARQLADLAADRTDLFWGAVVGPAFQLEHLLAEELLLPRVHEGGRFGLLLGIVGKGLLDLLLDGPELRIAGELVLVAGVQRGLGLLAPLRLDLVPHLLVEGWRCEVALGLACLGGQLLNRRDDLLAALVAAPDRLDHGVFVSLVGIRFDHHDPVFCGRDGDVDVGVSQLLVGRVQDPLILAQARHPHRAGGVDDRDV